MRMITIMNIFHGRGWTYHMLRCWRGRHVEGNAWILTSAPTSFTTQNSKPPVPLRSARQFSYEAYLLCAYRFCTRPWFRGHRCSHSLFLCAFALCRWSQVFVVLQYCCWPSPNLVGGIQEFWLSFCCADLCFKSSYAMKNIPMEFKYHS